MDILENNTSISNLTNTYNDTDNDTKTIINSGSGGESVSGTNLFKFNTKTKKVNETIHDKCSEAYYVIDNSVSMGESDGKIFMEDNGKLNTLFGVTRWEEASQKILLIAKYNINRKMKATYYLLNPKYRQNWVEDKDFIFINPESNNVQDKLKILEKTLLNHINIRGNTPLDVITEKLFTELNSNISLSLDYSINYNLITDGCPNSRLTFENSIKRLAKKFPVFLTINLCTEDNGVVEYYNGLDKTIGNELSGMDVIDDLKSEAIEITDAGNTFFTYSREIHICRMAGCFSVVADLLDEETLSTYHTNKLVKEILGLPTNTPHWTNMDAYLEVVKNHNKEVFDIYSNRNKPLVNIFKLKYLIFIYNLKTELTNFYNKNKLIICGVVWLFAVILFKLMFS